MKIAEFFQEDNGHLSSMRLMSFEIVNTGLFIAVFSVIQGKIDFAIISLILSMITLGLTGKAVQKSEEEKVETPEPIKP